MKVLVTSKGDSLESEVDPRFGRAELYALVETETNHLEVVPNESGRESMQGAGIRAAETAAKLGVEAVITGHCGPKAFAALRAAGIAVVPGATGTVAEAIEAYRAGRLSATDASDVSGHWK